MKKLVSLILAFCLLCLSSSVFALEDYPLKGFLSEDYVTDATGTFSVLTSKLDNPTRFDVCEETIDEIQLSIKNFTPEMLNQHIEIINDESVLPETGFYHIQPVVLLNAQTKLTEYNSQSSSASYIDSYAEFVQKGMELQDENCKAGQRISGLQLIDLNFDNTPELVIYDGGAGGGLGINIVSMVNGEAKLRYYSGYFYSNSFDRSNAAEYLTEYGWTKSGWLYGSHKCNSFELRRNITTGEDSWYLKHETDNYDENGNQTLDYELFRFEKDENVLLTKVSSAYGQSLDNLYAGTDTEPMQTDIQTLRRYNDDFSDNSQFKNAMGSTTAIKEWLSTYEKNRITVTINGENLTFDQQPIIINYRTLVPLRTIFEALGADVSWNDDTQTVTSVKGETTISMSIGKAEMTVNNQTTALDVAPQLIGDRTLVPVRAVAEGFSCKVDWDEETKTVIITK